MYQQTDMGSLLNFPTQAHIWTSWIPTCKLSTLVQEGEFRRKIPSYLKMFYFHLKRVLEKNKKDWRGISTACAYIHSFVPFMQQPSFFFELFSISCIFFSWWQRNITITLVSLAKAWEGRRRRRRRSLREELFSLASPHCISDSLCGSHSVVFTLGGFTHSILPAFASFSFLLQF